MNIFYPDSGFPMEPQISVFLAGSIEQGTAIDWQSYVIEKLKDFPVDVYNPRGKTWDTSLPQDPTTGPFRDQVCWELENMGNADLVFFYFAEGTTSPISLLELGLCIGYGKNITVCCPRGFSRYGNVKITCEAAGIKVFESIDEALGSVTPNII